MSFAACEKDIVTNTPHTGVEIDLENSIQFNTGITTRGQLVMDEYLQDHFAVYGYVYRSSWQAAEAMAKPNVFISDADNKESFIAWCWVIAIFLSRSFTCEGHNISLSHF